MIFTNFSLSDWSNKGIRLVRLVTIGQKILENSDLQFWSWLLDPVSSKIITNGSDVSISLPGILKIYVKNK